MGRLLVAGDDGVPAWTLDPETVDADDPPWWLPDGTAVDPTVTCDACEAVVSVREVVTPVRSTPDADGAVFCADCWERWEAPP